MRDETLDDYLERNNLFLCRQLTDEEISEVMNQYDWQYCPEIFARAILKKAQEKSSDTYCKHGFDMNKCKCPKCEAGIY